MDVYTGCPAGDQPALCADAGADHRADLLPHTGRAGAHAAGEHAGRGIADCKTPLAGLYPGLPTKTTVQPTTVRVLQTFVRAEPALLGLPQGDGMTWLLPPSALQEILRYLHLPEDLYEQLISDSYRHRPENTAPRAGRCRTRKWSKGETDSYSPNIN